MTPSTITHAQTWLAFALPLLLASSFSPALAATTDAVIEAAKREGEVVYYASMNLSEANALIGEFEKCHPYIKVKLQRSGSEKLLTRVLTEARAKKSFADVIQTVEFSMHIFSRAGLLARYIPQANSFYPKDFKDEGYWTTVYYNAYITAYNTRLVTSLLLPKTYDDLLDPRWKGKLMMEGTKAEWFAGMLQIMGAERGLKYMRDLAKQQPSPREGHELLAQLVAAGEGHLDINIPAASVERMKERGAPIDWVALGPAPAVMVGIGLSAQAAHPNAAKLFLDFVLSREGQKLAQTPGRFVARADLAANVSSATREIKMAPVSPALAEKLEEYAKQLRSIFGN
ncbi:MAG: extracellular solute-binding protein [Deltaproteobacteria bacterium]|nr:extracellular solute-binding protein [Deltaproteobacteria bacterium]